MKPVRIDFAAPNGGWVWSMRRASVRIFLALLLAAAAVAAVVVLRAQQIEREVEQAQDALAQMTRLQQKSALLRSVSERQTPEEEAMLQQAQRLRELPWEAIFQALETPTAAVRLQSLEPDLQRGIVKLQLHAEDLAAMQAYVQALQQSPVFRRVALQRHATPGDGSGGLDFACEAVLAAAYRLPEAVETQP